MPAIIHDSEKAEFDKAIRTLESEVFNAGVFLNIDANARLEYTKKIHAMSQELSAKC